MLGQPLYHEAKSKGVDVVVVSPGDSSTEFRSVVDLKNTFSVVARSANEFGVTAVKALGNQSVVADGVVNEFTACEINILPRKRMLKASHLLCIA